MSIHPFWGIFLINNSYFRFADAKGSSTAILDSSRVNYALWANNLFTHCSKWYELYNFLALNYHFDESKVKWRIYSLNYLSNFKIYEQDNFPYSLEVGFEWADS